MCRGVIQRLNELKVIKWFNGLTLKDYVFLYITILLIVSSFGLSFAWGNGINSQFYGHIVKVTSSSSEGYTPEFEKNMTEFVSTIKEYGTIALTLFGFTFIGGIFNLRRDNTIEGRLSRITTMMIFSISILFLFCFMSLHLLTTFIYPYVMITIDTIFLLLNIGLSLFIVSVNILLYTLILYIARYVTLPRYIDIY